MNQVFDVPGISDEQRIELMREEHMERSDSHELFPVRLFGVGGVETTMAAEWCAVVKPEEFRSMAAINPKLNVVKLPRGGTSARHLPASLAMLDEQHAEINRQLKELHEAPFTRSMLIACRIFSGFAFRKCASTRRCLICACPCCS